MKPFLLSLGFLFAALRVVAFTPIPFTEGVSFTYKLAPTGGTYAGGGSVTISAEGSASSGGGVNGVESPLAFALMRPGKECTFTIAGTFIGTGASGGVVTVGLNAPSGYAIYIDQVPQDIYVKSFGGNGNSSYSESHKIELRPIANAAPADAGSFSGIEIGKSVSWEIGLGRLRAGQSAGRILFKEMDLSSSPASRDRLFYPMTGNNSQITAKWDGASNQTLRQLSTPQTVVDLLDDVGGGGYLIKFYTPTQATVSGAIYTFTNQTPWKTIHVTSAAANQLTIMETEGAVERTSSLSLTSGSVATGIYLWTVQEGDHLTALRTTTHSSSVPTTNQRDDLVTVRNGGSAGSIVSQTKFHYVMQPWNTEDITQVIADPNGAALTTSYTYFTTSSAYGNYRKIQSVTGPTGNWTSYLYYDDWNRRGRLALETHPYLDAPASAVAAALTVGNSISYDYQADYSGRYGNESNRQYKTTNFQTGQKLTTPAIGFSRNGVSYTSYATSDYAATSAPQQTTVERSDPAALNSDYGNQAYSVKRADQSQDSYAYFQGTYSGTTFTVGGTTTPIHFRTNIWHGSTNAGGADSFATYGGAIVTTIYLVPNKSTMEVIIQDPAGLVLRKETHVYVGSGNFTLLASENYTYDVAGRSIDSVASNDTTANNHYLGGRIDYTVDATGTQTNFTYDLLGRVASSAKQSVGTSGLYAAQSTITTSNMYDGVGHLTQSQTTGGALTLTSTAQYDLAGRPTQQVQFAGSANSLTTGYSYSAGGRIVTATLPGTATKTTETYLDGQLKQVTGSAVVAENYSYWIDGAGQSVRQATFGGNTAMWTTTYSDWLGRPHQEQKPGWNGTAVDKFWYYNSSGQLWKFTQPGLAATLYEYDTFGRQTAQGLDINGNDLLDRTGNDRITQRYVGIYTWDSGATWWSSAQTFVSADPASSSSTVIETAMTRLNLNSGNLAQTNTYDANWNVTSQVTAVNRIGKLVTTTTTAPDSTTPAQQKFYNGLLMEANDTASVNMKYVYDGLGRQTQSIDPRTGTTTTGYNSGSNFVYWVIDPANVFKAIYQYDSAGRTIVITAPNPTYVNGGTEPQQLSTRYAFNDRNQPLQQWGDNISPTESVYDSLGRQTELHTFRAGSGWSGSGWPTATKGTTDITTWAYQAATGLLASKTAASGPAVTFTYTQAGQLERRTLARGAWTNYAYSPTTAETTAVTYSDGTTALSYAYNRLGQCTTVGDYAGTRTFTYNVGGTLELQREDQPNFLTGRRLTYGYDSTAGAVGRLKTMSLGTAAAPTADQNVTYAYNTVDGRLNSINSGGQTFVYGYTGNSHLINTVSNTAANYSDTRAYDLNHDWISSRVTTITGATKPIKASFVSTRDTFGRVTQTAKTGELYNRYGNGNDALNTNYGYNDRSEITADQTKVGSTGAVLSGRDDSHVYDSIGNRSTVTHNGNGAGYTVNNLNQYVSRTVPGIFDVAGAAQTNFTVTVNGSNSGVSRSGDYYFKGQPLTNTGAAVSASIPISDGSAVGSLTAFLAGTPEAMVYDLDGNLTTDGRWDYGYDAENRLNWMSTRDAAVSTLVPKVAMQILYDYLGRRIWKISYTWNKASSSWNLAHHEMFIYNGWNLIAEINGGTGAITKNILWGIDLSGTAQGAGGVGGLLMTQDGGQSYLPMYDGNGNVHGMIKASDGTIAAAYEYDAFGNTLRESGTYAASNTFRYSTKYTDLESGLVYYGRRYYSPSLGRFINKDPIEEAGGVNLYSFCGNNGVNGVDYLGMDLIKYKSDQDFWNQNQELKSWLDGVRNLRSGSGGTPGLPTAETFMYGDVGGRGNPWQGGYYDANGNFLGFTDPNKPDLSRFSPGGHSAGFFSDPPAGENLPTGFKVVTGKNEGGKTVTAGVQDASGKLVATYHLDPDTGRWVSDAPNSGGRVNSGGFLGTNLTAREFFSAAGTGALGGAAGFQNRIFFGATSTTGFDPASVQTGQSIGTATMVTTGAVATAGAFSLASGMPYFYSGAGASTQAAASGYIMADTAGGMVANGAQQALNTVFGARLGGTIGYYGIWYPTSAVYATTSGLLNGVVGYTGNGTGQIWTQVERPILQFFGTTIK